MYLPRFYLGSSSRPTNGLQEILERVQAFLPRFRDEVLAPLTPEALAKHKASLVNNLLEPPKTLVGECGLHWAEVTNETREWRRARLYADAAEAVTLEELLALYNGLVLEKETRRKLCVLVHGNKHPMPERPPTSAEDEGVVYLAEEDWLAFRSSRPLFPCTPAYPSSSL
jgi:secreted Zn-dependent insulinase-like peptidase